MIHHLAIFNKGPVIIYRLGGGGGGVEGFWAKHDEI